jgi:hypothetical protein
VQEALEEEAVEVSAAVEVAVEVMLLEEDLEEVQLD